MISAKWSIKNQNLNVFLWIYFFSAEKFDSIYILKTDFPFKTTLRSQNVVTWSEPASDHWQWSIGVRVMKQMLAFFLNLKRISCRKKEHKHWLHTQHAQHEHLHSRQSQQSLFVLISLTKLTIHPSSQISPNTDWINFSTQHLSQHNKC